MTVGELLATGALALQGRGIEAPRREARLLLAAASGHSLSHITAWPDHAVPPDAAASFRRLLDRRVGGEPLSRISGRREFWSLEFELNPDVLDPRPDTETLVAAALDRLHDRGRAWHILDLGTGSGALIIALLHELPNARGIGIDLAPGAVHAARQNALRLGVADRASFAVMDWCAAIAGRFDLVISNPPYISSADISGLEPGVRDFDPVRALDGGADGLDAYRSLARAIPSLLTDDGIAVIELGFGQAGSVSALMPTHGLAVLGIERDLAGIERALVATLRGAGRTLQK